MDFQKFEEKLNNNLYKIWNRISSGSYFPQPVMAVEIPKKTGGVRRLGIPTITDRIAQMVARMYVERAVEPTAHVAAVIMPMIKKFFLMIIFPFLIL